MALVKTRAQAGAYRGGMSIEQAARRRPITAITALLPQANIESSKVATYWFASNEVNLLGHRRKYRRGWNAINVVRFHTSAKHSLETIIYFYRLFVNKVNARFGDGSHYRFVQIE